MWGWFWRRELCTLSLIQRRAPRPRRQGPPGTQLLSAGGRGEGRRRQPVLCGGHRRAGAGRGAVWGAVARRPVAVGLGC